MYKSTYHTKEELINTLEKRGMTVSDSSILDEVNYSHIIYKYGKYFIEIENDNEIKYKDGTDILHLYNLYIFNNKLSTKLLYIFSKIEHKMRSSIVQHISKQDPLIYLESTFYSNESRNGEIDEFIDSLKKTEEARRDKYDVKHLLSGKLPLWLLVDELPIGQLRMFMKLTEGLQKLVLNDMNIAHNKWWIIRTFNKYRNVLAHMDIVESIADKDPKFDLLRLLMYMKNNYKEDYRELIIFLKDYNFNDIGISKYNYLKKLGF